MQPAPDSSGGSDDIDVDLAAVNVRYAFGYDDVDARQAIFATVLEPSALLDVDGLPGADEINAVVHGLAGAS